MHLLLAPLLLLVFLMYCARSADLPADYDYWWHFKAGQYIAETGAIPRADDFSYTAAGRPWVAHEWLTELVLYRVQRAVGYVGNVVLFALIATVAALAVYRTCRLRGLGEVAAALLMIWASIMASLASNVRAQVVTLALVAVFALLLTRYRRGEARALWPLPPLMSIWVNLHGGYIMGLVLLGLCVMGETLALTGVRRRLVAPPRSLLLVTVLSAGATLLSPHGFEALGYPFQYAGTENVHLNYIQEWQSPNFHRLGAPWVLTFLPTLLLVAVLGVGRRSLGATELLWTLALTAMALQSVRHIALYAVVVTPLLGARLRDAIPALGRPLATWRRPGLVAVFWPLVAVGAIRMVTAGGGLEQLRPGQEPPAATYPTGAVEYIRAHELRGNLFNEYHWGGYLIYQLYPEQRVFIDGRADVYGDLLDRHQLVVKLKPNWRQVLEEHDVRLALLEKESPLAVVLGDDPGWQELHAGEAERLFARRAP